MRWSVTQGDCLELLKSLPSGSVDAVITDPPYGVDFKYETHDDTRIGYREWCRVWFGELQRVCSGAILITIGQANLSNWGADNPPKWWGAWWKPAAMGRCVVGFNNWEPIAIYGKPKRAGCDVIRACIVPDEDLEGHPCPKPKEWAVGQLKTFTNEGDTILDPFSGSGTTGVACVMNNRNFIGYEIDPKYCEIARRRIEAAIPLQLQEAVNA